MNIQLAHEVYVLSPTQVQRGLAETGPDLLAPFHNSTDQMTIGLVGLGVLLLLVAGFFFSRTQLAAKISTWLERFSAWGPVAIRVAVAAALFFSVYSNSFLGPELALAGLPLTQILKLVLLASGGLILLGIQMPLAAAAAGAVFILATFYHGWYMLTYLSYLGEFLVLLFAAKPWVKRYEIDIIRICYGLALIYATINIKFLHPILTYTVVTQYHLTNFHWLFPSDPLLVTLGAGICELLIATFILLGFQTRLMVLVSLFYITLSLLYFGEAVWPHFILYGISIALLVTRQNFSLDKKISQWYDTNGN